MAQAHFPPPPTMGSDDAQLSRKQAVQGAHLRLESDPNHHLTGPFLPHTPLGSTTPIRTGSPAIRRPPRACPPAAPWWLQWATEPYVALKLLLIPIALYSSWPLVSPYLAPSTPNPFAHVFLLSGYLEDSSPQEPRYAKTYYDLLFLAYYIIFFSLVRQFIVVSVSRPIALYFGLRKESKIDRYGEQFYALLYFSFFGSWGYRIMNQLPTNWYQTQHFWIGYPHWNLKPELKRYYLMQFAYWLHQFIVLVLGLEKPRKDYYELVAHHFVTLWLVGWSYFLNFTFIGHAVYMSMDIPDAFFAASKLLNYMQWERTKLVSFVTFIFVWTYFRHFLNIKMLWSVLYETNIVPETTRIWDWSTGTYMIWWMPPFIFASIFALQLLNLFWYFLIWRVLIRAILTRVADDDRSDEEEDGDPAANDKED